MKLYLNKFILMVVLAVLPIVVTANDSNKKPLAAITQLDVTRYLGHWYEIAKFPNRFQKQCVSDTSAEYSTLPDGNIRVLNQCLNSAGNMESAIGEAKQMGGPQSAKLKVRFAPAWLSFLPFVWGDYWVIDLDDKYTLVAVSEPNREFLWVLSRTPVVDQAHYAELMNRLEGMNFDIKKLEKTPQTPASKSTK